jgi:hypothetical protein
MTTDREDDALSWAGDDDPTLSPPVQTGNEGAPDAVAVPRETADVPHAAAPAGPAAAVEAARTEAAPADQRAHAKSGVPTVLEQAELAEDAAAEAELAAAEKESAQLSSAALIGLGILGGVYLLYTIGWVISVMRAPAPDQVDFTVLMNQFGQVLAIAAPPLWFISTLLLTKARSTRSRIGWLLLGAFVLVPWPFILGV